MSDAKVEKLGKRARNLRGVFVLSVVLTLTAAVLFLSLALVSINQRSAGTREILNNVNESTRILVDCTTPGHDCYQRGLRNQAAAVGQLNKIIVLAAFCAKQPANGSVQRIQACVVKGLK